MHRINIGEFEELVLLMVGVLNQDAYGVAVMEEIEEQTGRKINISAVHSALRRLEAKGYLTSSMGGATSERGGRRKRIFTLTHGGKLALDQIKDLRTRLWNQIPNMAVQKGN